MLLIDLRIEFQFMDEGTAPEWLIRSKVNLMKTEEWQSFQDELEAAVDRQLIEGQVSHFTDLSEEEKRATVQHAVDTLQDGNSYKSLCLSISNDLGSQILKSANSKVASARSQTAYGWPNFQQEADEGIVYLMKKWPEMKYKFHACLNTQLPPVIRKVAWSLHLENPQVKAEYLEKSRHNAEDVMSILDLEITRKCELLLQTEPTFQPLKAIPKSLHLMKSVLSFYHLTRQISSSLIDTDYMLAVPFVYNTLSTKPTAPLHEIDKATTVEQFFSFMETRFGYMKESYNSEFETSWSEFNRQLISRLSYVDNDMQTYLKDVLAKDSSAPSADGFVEGMKALARPMVRCLFVGFLSLDTVMFVWDQYVIGMDVPSYDIVPYITAVTFSLLRLPILQCQNTKEVAECLRTNAIKLKKEHFMYEINRCFYRYLSATLHGGRAGKMEPTHYPAPWKEGMSDYTDAETQKLKTLLDEESKKMQEMKEKSALELTKLKKEIETLKEKIEKLKQEQNKEGKTDQGEEE